MKKSFFLVLFCLVTTILVAQSNFDRGFKDGYVKGYCHDRGLGCIPPIPPIPPMPNLSERSESYQDGYNRGFQMGLGAQPNSTNNTNNNNQDRPRYKATSPTFIDGINTNVYPIYNSNSYNNNLSPKTVSSEYFFSNIEIGFSNSIGLNQSYESEKIGTYSGYNFDLGLCLSYYLSEIAFLKSELLYNNIISDIQTGTSINSMGNYPESPVNLKYIQVNLSICGGAQTGGQWNDGSNKLFYGEIGISGNINLKNEFNSKNYSSFLVGVGIGNYRGSYSMRFFFGNKMTSIMNNGVTVMLNYQIYF